MIDLIMSCKSAVCICQLHTTQHEFLRWTGEHISVTSTRMCMSRAEPCSVDNDGNTPVPSTISRVEEDMEFLAWL